MNEGHGFSRAVKSQGTPCRLRNNVMNEGHGFSRAAKSQGTPLQAAEQRYGRRARVQPCRKKPGHAFCRLRNNVMNEGHAFSRAVKSQGTPLQAAEQRYGRRAGSAVPQEPGHAFAGCGTTL